MTAQTLCFYKFLVIALLALLGCESALNVRSTRVEKDGVIAAPSPPPIAGEKTPACSQPATQASVAANTDPAAFPGGYSWLPPASWTAGRSSSMRIGSYAASIDQQDADISVIRLAGSAGGVVANVGRWAEQIGLTPLPAAEVKDRQRLLSSKAGEFSVWTLENPENEKAMSVALLNGQDHVLFVKMTGPLVVVQGLGQDFEQFLGSFTSKGAP